jgi:hypothetical protein
MTITHKILVSNDTGKVIHPAYEIDHPRPCPSDCTWIELKTGEALYNHYCIDPPVDVAHLDLNEIYWDFEGSGWVEVPTTSLPSYEKSKFTRNELLKGSDLRVATCTDPVELEAWKLYRQQLRDMFKDLPLDYDWNMLVFPRRPQDIAALKEKAAAGDAEAAAIVLRDNL